MRLAEEATTGAFDGSAISLAHLRGHLALLEARVRLLVAIRRGGDPNPEDAFRGLYVAEEHVDALLASSPSSASALEGAEAAVRDLEVRFNDAAPLRLRQLVATFGLTELDRDLLLVALAPDLDPRFEKLYGYLHDDVTRRRASPGLALELTGRSPLDGAARDRFHRSAPLLRSGLLVLEETDRPYLTRVLRVPDRVSAHLLCSDEPAGELRGLLRTPLPAPGEATTALQRGLAAGFRLAYLRQQHSGPALAVGCTAVRDALGEAPVAVELAGLAAEDAHEVAKVAVREARLRGTGLVIGSLEAMPAETVRTLAAAAAYEPVVPTVLIGTGPWDPGVCEQAPLQLQVPDLRPQELASVWREQLGAEKPGQPGSKTGGDAAEILPESVTAFRLGPEAVVKAVASARAGAAAEGVPLAGRHVIAGARLQNGVGLQRLARHIVPAVGWDDLVLPGETREGLEHLIARVQHRGRVLDDWGMHRGGGRGEAVLALFAGESGTGKTMAAEVIAGALGLEMYVLELSSVVDKYIGETEKNLERIFTEAASVNGVLFFDEADAIFGKRSEVSDARDRYANLEVSYLLQRMETFDGLAILATNLRANLDEAFARRLSLVVDFGRPDVEQRRVLWAKSLGAVPLAADVDLDYCAQAFDLAGGDIRSIAVSAAYSAAAAGEHLDMSGLVKAIQGEYRKLGRLCVEAEFGPYYGLLAAPS